MKQLEKQQKKLAAKGIHVDIESLRKDYDAQKAGGVNERQNGKFDHHHFDARSVDAEIDVVGDDDDDECESSSVTIPPPPTALSMMFPPVDQGVLSSAVARKLCRLP